ncbi:DNA repair protein [Aquabacterium sp. NJ1]|uniref:DNA repair protein RecN n=1 Tax=Aquabacterium sp. NJ1 TaxID=1538295 RepID=UPI00052BD31C|nr:DNA repair protein RecN [Aquabacterium sp. NJ1]KGM39540.1 DNA repair protein [Aquabacterium sp. NJ1]
MLRRLTLRDFVIVTSLEVDLGGGFTALTGETGAGKSILIDALQLALGSRGDSGVVREGAARADITAEFDPSSELAARLAPWLEEAGFDNLEAGAPLLLRRVVDAQGKSRAWINGSTATVSQLRELGEHLVDIHGQHAWQSLTRADSVRALVDAQAGVDTPALQQAWAARREAQRRLDEARSKQADLDRERERLQWQITELDKLGPQADEWDTLNAEHQRLSHGQAILDAARMALGAVSEADSNAESLTSRAIDALEEVAGVEPNLANALEVLREAQAQLQDAAHSLNSALHHTELDPDRLAELDNRMSAWMSLSRRYRRPAPELPALLQSWRAELAELDAAADLDALEREAQRAHKAWLDVAKAVSKQRAQAAPAMAQAVTEAMQDLGMAGGRFEVALVKQDEPQAYGLENIEFLVAGHAGSTPRPLGKVASGGELSRLALAIAVTTSQRADETAQVGTLIFDEIDSGVGGAVADTVGLLMQRLGRERQVMAVTHLAQVAACAHQHLVVSKALSNGQTASDIREVQADARVHEVARMLGGAITDTSRAHAQAMLQTASKADKANATNKARPARKEAA